MGDIRGEYWIIGGQVDFADGDIGDQNHESIAINHILADFVDEIKDLAEEYEVEFDPREEYGIDPQIISDALSEIFERVQAAHNLNDQQTHTFIANQLGANPEAYQILLGGGDARYYVMKYSGWIAVRSNNVEVFGYDASKQKEIADGINTILFDEGDEDSPPEETELYIYDFRSNKSWDATLADLEAPQVVSRPQQLPQTTYNRTIGGTRDEEENKYSPLIKSKQRPIDAAARQSNLIGPGQQLWRGTSESFSEWLRLQES